VREPVKRIRGRKRKEMNAITLTANPLCVKCQKRGVVTPATEVDHVVALVNGGADDLANRQGLCDDCHTEKTRRDLGYRERSGCDASGLPTSPTHHWNAD